MIDAARRTFAAGKTDAALQMLSSFTPAHALVTTTLGELQIEAKEMERRREIERVKREIAQKLEDAAARMREQDFEAVLAQVKGVLAYDAKHPDALALKKRAEEALERKRQVAAELATAKKLIDAKKFQEAILAVARVAALDPAAPGLADARRAADAGLEAEAAARVRAEIESHLAAAAKALDAKDYPRALDRVQSALRIEPAHAAAIALKEKIENAIAASQAALAKAAAQAAATAGAKAAAAAVAEAKAAKPSPASDQTVVMKAEPPGEKTVLMPAPAAARTVEMPSPAVPAVPALASLTPAPPSAQLTVLTPAPVAEKPSAAARSGATIVLPAQRQTAPEEIGAAPGQESSAKPFPRGVIIGVAAAVLLVIAIVVGLKMRPSGPGDQVVTPAVGAPVAVSLVTAPWANIDAVTSKSDGKAVDVGQLQTPCVLTLPPGTYHVRASNPNVTGPFEFDLTVTASGGEVHQVLPGFKPETEIDRILNQ